MFGKAKPVVFGTAVLVVVVFKSAEPVAFETAVLCVVEYPHSLRTTLYLKICEKYINLSQFALQCFGFGPHIACSF